MSNRISDLLKTERLDAKRFLRERSDGAWRVVNRRGRHAEVAGWQNVGHITAELRDPSAPHRLISAGAWLPMELGAWDTASLLVWSAHVQIPGQKEFAAKEGRAVGVTSRHRLGAGYAWEALDAAWRWTRGGDPALTRVWGETRHLLQPGSTWFDRRPTLGAWLERRSGGQAFPMEAAIAAVHYVATAWPAGLGDIAAPDGNALVDAAIAAAAAPDCPAIASDGIRQVVERVRQTGRRLALRADIEAWLDQSDDVTVPAIAAWLATSAA